MKKTSACIIALCLTASGCLAAKPLFPIGHPAMEFQRPFYENWTEEEVTRLREDVKDAGKLQERLKEILNRVLTEGSNWTLEDFKREFGVKDEVLETALIALYHMPPSKAGWRYKKRDGSMLSTRVEHDDSYHFLVIPGWLGFCAGPEGKKLLMSIATDKKQIKGVRWETIAAYLRRGDTQEIRDAVPRFLASMKGEESIDVENIYRIALDVYDHMDDDKDKQKQEAIIAAVSAALMKEEDKKVFPKADGWMMERSKEYAESPQRKAALERMNKPPEEKTPNLTPGKH